MAYTRRDWTDRATPALSGANLDALELAVEQLKLLAYDPRDYGAVWDGVTNDYQAIQDCYDDVPEGGTMLIPSGVGRHTSQLAFNRRVNLIGFGMGSCLKPDVGAATDGVVIGSLAGLTYGLSISNFSVIGGANAALHALVFQNLAHSVIDKVWAKAGTPVAGYCVSVEGCLINWFNLIIPGANSTFPFAATSPVNAMRVIGSALYPPNANRFDLIIEAVTGDGLVQDIGDTKGAVSEQNNWYSGTIEGIEGDALRIVGGENWSIQNMHLEATTILGVPVGNALRLESTGPGHIGPGIHATAPIELVACTDIVLDGIDGDVITVDADCDNIRLGRVDYGKLSGGDFVDWGVNTESDGRVSRTGASDSSRAPSKFDGDDNLLVDGGFENWTAAGAPLWGAAAVGAVTKTGDGEADTRKRYGTYAAKMTGAGARLMVYPDTADSALMVGQFVSLSAWVYIASGQADTPLINIQAYLNGGAPVKAGTQIESRTDEWVKLTQTVWVPEGTTSVQLALVNTHANDGTWYVDGASIVLGRAAAKAQAPRAPRVLTANVTWNPASIANGATGFTSVTVRGAAVGDRVRCSMTSDLNLVTLHGYVSAAHTVIVAASNVSGAAWDIPSGTLRVEVLKD